MRTTGSDGRIFVQIPAYRDSELASTLADLYHKAANPQQLRVAVLWQRGPDEMLPDSVKRLSGLELIQVPSEESRGCNWARSIAQGHWRGEEYTLLLDSHHRFASGWDTTIVNMHRRLEKGGVAKPLLTAYLPAYLPNKRPSRQQNRPFKIYPHKRERGLLIHLTSFPILNWKQLTGPVPAQLASGHFIFARGELNRDMPFDPMIYFTGDEMSMSLRAHTLGYDLFHPHVVLAWHCYDRATRGVHWGDHDDWRDLHERSLRRVRRLFSGTLSGKFGLGNVRSRASFESRLLIPLIERGVYV